MPPTIQASSPNTYRTPVAPRRGAPVSFGSTDTSGAYTFANALSNLNPAIQGFLKTSFDFYRDRERAKGQAWAAENQAPYRDAVRSGKLPAGASPFFAEAVAREGLRRSAEEFELGLIQEYEQSGQLQSLSQNEFFSLLQSREREFLKGLPGDPAFVNETVAPVLNSVERRLNERHISETIARTEERGRNQLFAGVTNVIERVRSYDALSVAEEGQTLGVDLGSAKTIDEVYTATTAKGIQAQADALFDVGMRGKEINGIVVDAITAQAVAESDLSLLDLMDEIRIGPGGRGSLGGTQYASEQRASAEVAIAAKQKRAEGDWWTQYTRGRAIAGDEALTQLYGYLEAGDPKGVEVALEGIRQFSPGTYGKAVRAVQAYQNTDIQSDPQVAHDIERDLALGYTVSQSELDTMLANGELSRDDHVKYTKARTSQDKAQMDYAEDVSNHARRVFNPANDLLSALPDGRARQGEAEAEAAVLASRWYTDFVEKNERRPGLEDQIKGQELIMTQLQANPRFAPLLQEPGFAVPSPTTPPAPADTPGLLRQAYDYLTSAQPEQSVDIPTEPPRRPSDAAIADLRSRYTTTTDQAEAQALLDNFDAIFGPGAAAQYIMEQNNAR